MGNLRLGGDNPIRVQSMTNTSTMDTASSVAQILRIAEAGGELVRLTTQGTREAENMAFIHRAVREAGCSVPLVADVHFNPNVADVAARYVEKVRINPGNYVDAARQFKQLEYSPEQYAQELQKIEDRLVPFLQICKEHDTAIRIGVNHGSLSDRIMSHYGDTPAGIVESCMEFLRICTKHRFFNVVISIKASNTVVMVRSMRLLVEQMQREGMTFPLHLGVTEAGEGEDGRIKSAVGIGALLTEGIGDTIRVSLSEAPEKEIPVARALVEMIPECRRLRQEAESSIKDDTVYLSLSAACMEELQLKAAMAVGALFIDKKAHRLNICCPGFSDVELTALSDAILQAARIKFVKTEYISCPGCGRTLYDLEGTIRRIKAATAHLKGLKIAIMGCIVNGPGEMADADYGYVGAARGKVSLYRSKVCVEKNIPEEEAVDRLLRLIESDKIQISPATPSDASFIALVVVEALGDVVMGRTGDSFTPEELLRLQLLEKAILEDDTLYSYRNTIIAKDSEGSPLGAIVSYVGKDYQAMRQRTFSMLQEIIHFDTATMDDETGPGEYYLDSLSVSPQARGKGIGSRLLLAAVSRAGELGLPATLACDPSNERARTLYESLGFRHDGELFIFGHQYLRMTCSSPSTEGRG